MAELTLISSKLCPFVQRATITLEEKGAQYDVEYIDVANKPDWFLELSPTGKVPALKVGETVLFESAVINEYLDETTPGPRLLPEDPLARAQSRAWIEFVSDLVVSAIKLARAEEESQVRKIAGVAHDKLARLEQELVGPWFAKELSLVDTTAAPALQRLTFLEEIVPGLGVFAGLPKAAAWRDALLARPSVQRSAVPELRDLYRDHLAGSGSWIGRQLV